MVFLSIASGFALWFVSSERTIYIWDFAGYWHRTHWFANLMRDDPGGAFAELWRSMQQDDYGALPTLGILPATWLLGSSRAAYVLSIVFVYGSCLSLMLVLACRRFATTAEALTPGLAALAALSPLLFPWFLTPILRGYLDCGGVAIGLAVLWLYFARQSQQLRSRELVVIGLLLALLVLFRRWYAFWVVSFFVMITVDAALQILAAKSLRPAAVLGAARPILLVGIIFAATLLTLAAPAVVRMATTDYAGAFAAYHFGGGLLGPLSRIPTTFGWASLSLVGTAWAALLTWRDTRRLAALLGVQLIFVYLHFTRVQDFGIHHWYLLQPAVLLVLAIAAARLVCTLRSRRFRILALTGMAASGVFVSGVVFVPSLRPIGESLGTLMPRVPWHPLVREDLAEVRRLVEGLEAAFAELGSGASLYVLASSSVLSSDHFLRADLSIGLRPTWLARLRRTADVDRRDGFPDALLDADIICATWPPAIHLDYREQLVVVVPTIHLFEGIGIGRAFEKLPPRFELEGGYSVSLFRRVRPVSAEETQALSAQLRIGHPDNPLVTEPRVPR